ncbi:unnamed protein product [Cunninghamella echinulata]
MPYAIKRVHSLKNNKKKKLSFLVYRNSDCLVKKVHDYSVNRDVSLAMVNLVWIAHSLQSSIL